MLRMQTGPRSKADKEPKRLIVALSTFAPGSKAVFKVTQPHHRNYEQVAILLKLTYNICVSFISQTWRRTSKPCTCPSLSARLGHLRFSFHIKASPRRYSLHSFELFKSYLLS